jgi:hypothetical protein
MFKREAKRWLRALKIARIILEDEGCHPRILEEMEHMIRRSLMYSPKIKEEFLPMLFKISASKGVPMTKLVNQIIRDYLEENYPSTGVTAYDERKSKTGSGEYPSKV